MGSDTHARCAKRCARGVTLVARNIYPSPDPADFRGPMTDSQIASALGLTHVNLMRGQAPVSGQDPSARAQPCSKRWCPWPEGPIADPTSPPPKAEYKVCAVCRFGAGSSRRMPASEASQVAVPQQLNDAW
nr:hypothetical protein BaRGS_019670 [Batillaria attramentaria]